MQDIPECLNRRYKALNDLIEDIATAMPTCMGGPNASGGCSSTTATSPSCGGEPNSEAGSEVGIKLMCDFCKILQDDADINLTQAVQQHMCLETCTGKCSSAKKLYCKPSSTGSDGGGGSRVKHMCISGSKDSSTRRPKKHDCGATSTRKGKDVPLRKVLGNLKEAASFEKKCSDRLSELVSAQKDLTEQINNLEEKERKGVALMKQADSIWSCMEDSYKKKMAVSQERYQELQKQLKEVEASANKWRKNKKDLEFQEKNLNKCSQDIKEKKIQMENDVKVMELEIEGFKKRIASNQKDMNAAKNSYTLKKNASDARLAKIAEEMEKIQNKIGNECRCKADKENEGRRCIKEARDELQKISRALLHKKLENEDLRAKREALIQEIGILKNTCDTCTARCAKREKDIDDETKRIDKEISGFEAKCIKCHKFTDSADVTGFCVDCPRCLIQRECLREGDHCSTDHTKDCVCTRIKEKFLDNVFENMYTVLERQVKTCPGKELADCIFNCLKRSRNGKLDEATRKILQDFILGTVKKNLNLTIVGGAVKTRCEMEPDTYRQLMLCLKDVAVTRPVKEDKGTAAKKPPCSRWPSSYECNCPKGPKSCPCTKKAPKPPTYPGSCGQPDTEEVEESIVKNPPADSAACGVDSSMLGAPGAAERKREPRGGPSWPLGSNMRAAQCVLGPEALADVRATRPTPPIVPSIPCVKKMIGVNLDTEWSRKPWVCSHCGVYRRNTKHLKEDMKNNFNEVTRADYQKTTNKNLQLKLSLSHATSAQGSLKPTSSLQKAILLTNDKQENILEELYKNNRKQNYTNKQFQIAFKSENGQSNREFTELTQTPSGKLTIELDEQTIKIIEGKSITDPYLFMSIKTFSSGLVLVDFDTKENVIKNTHRVTVTRTSSGTILLDIHKNMIRILKDTLSNKIPNAGLSKSIKLPSSPNRSESPIDADTDLPHPITTDNHLEHISAPILTEIYKKHKKKKKLKCTCPKTTPDSDSCQLMSDTGLMLKNKKNAIPACSCDKSNTSSVSCKIIKEIDSPQELISSWKSSASKSVDNCNYRSEFKQLYKLGNANIAVKIQVENGVVQKLPTVVTKTKLGTIAIYVRVSLKGISFDGKEYPVLLSKTVSGTYFLRMGNNHQNFNATLTITPSEGILLIPQSFQEKHRNGHEVEDFFKVKLSVMINQLLQIPAVLKPTSSKNYLVVLDKEFETCYKETLKQYFGDNLEGSVDLHITSSGNYILELDYEDESHFEKKNALLVKTSSGHIKVLVHGPEFESMVQRKLSISSTSSAQASAQINNNLPVSSREFHRENLKKSKNLDNQSFGKLKLRDSVPLLSIPSTVLKKAPSGQYALVLNEESNKSLLNNLQSNSLTSNTEGLVTIKRLDSGETIVNLNNKDEEKTHYGALKITPSGKLYVVVDEEIMKDLTDSSTKNKVSSSAEGTRSIHATQLIDSVNKAVGTTCQAKSDDCCCDQSTCVCADFLFNTMDGSNGKLTQLCTCVWKEASADKYIPSTSQDKSGQIVFEPSCDLTARKNEFESTEQCFYWLGSGYPQHQLCYDGVSNKLLENTDFCQAHENEPEKKIEFESKSEEPAGQNAYQVWDSLNYLPPQLPYFLKDVRYR